MVLVFDLATLCGCCGAGILGGLAFGVLQAILEHSWYYFLVYLERKKLICRLAPSIPVTATAFYRETFWAPAISFSIPSALIFALRNRFIENCRFSFDFVECWCFTWIMMVLHDAYFWVVHTALHKYKPLYTKVHYLHHSTFGDITAFTAGYITTLEGVFTFTPFYSSFVLWSAFTSKWNPCAVAMLGAAAMSVHALGHCGYDLPAWVYGPGSLGILLTPSSQKPLHHYIHHLDTRFNRSLYFTWWDKLAGTFLDCHPKCQDVSYDKGEKGTFNKGRGEVIRREKLA